MKMKTVFAASLAAMALAACSQDADPGTPAPAAKTNFEVSLPGAAETYAVEDPQSAGQITPCYENVTVYLIDAGNNAVGYAWTDAEIKAKQKRFEQVVEPIMVGVVVNSGSVTMPTGSIHMDDLGLLTEQLAIADQNKSVKTLAVADAKGNAAGDYLPIHQVTLTGMQTTFTTEASDDGHTLKKAAVELKSLVSRFEVGTVKAGTGLEALTVEAVYINNFYDDINATSVTSYTEISWPSTYAPAWATDAANASVTSVAGTKAYAYQVFSGTVIPHIIYKVSGTVAAGYRLSDGTGDADNPTPFTDKYITVKGFKEGGVTLASIEPHKIYKMGLENGGIEITPDKITDNPEKTKIDLIMAITVADWTTSNVTPEI